MMKILNDGNDGMSFMSMTGWWGAPLHEVCT